MMSASLIRSIQNVAAARAQQERREPNVLFSVETFTDDLRHATDLGDYVPAGWRVATFADFQHPDVLHPKLRHQSGVRNADDDVVVLVDASGFGAIDEPALALSEFAECGERLFLAGAKAPLGVGITETGQFQVVVTFFVRDPEAEGEEIEFETCVHCESPLDEDGDCQEYAGGCGRYQGFCATEGCDEDCEPDEEKCWDCRNADDDDEED